MTTPTAQVHAKHQRPRPNPGLLAIGIAALLSAVSGSAIATVLTYDYYVTDLHAGSDIRFSDPNELLNFGLNGLPIGSKITLAFEIGGPEFCDQNRCDYTIGSFSLAGPGLDVAGVDGTSQSAFRINTHGANSMTAGLDYRKVGEFTRFGNSAETIGHVNFGALTDSFFSTFQYEVIPDASRGDPSEIDRTTFQPNQHELVAIQQHFDRLELRLVGNIGDEPGFGDTYIFTLTPGSRQFTWLGGDGDFNTASNWFPDETPGGGVTPDDVAFISADGNYTVSGAPDHPLSILNVGNASGTVTLAPVASNIQTDFLFIEGDTRLESGGVIVNIDAVVAREAEWVIAPSGTLAFLAGPGEPQTFLIDGRVRIEGGVLAPTVEVGDGPYDPAAGLSPIPGIEVAGPNAGLTVEQTLNLSTGADSHSEFLASAGARTIIGNEFITSSGLNSTSSVSFSGNGTSLTGDSGGDGVPFVTIGQQGHSLFSLDQGAMMAVDGLLLGENPGAHGELRITNGASVVQPPADAVSEPDLPAAVFIGFSGNGVVSVDTGGSFFNDRAYTGRLSLGEQVEGIGELLINGVPVGTAGNPQHVGFAETTIGVFGQGKFNLGGGAQWDSTVFSIGEGGFAGGEGSGPIAGVGDVGISGPGTELGLYGSRLLVAGGDGHGVLSVSDGARVVRSENPSADPGAPLVSDDPMALVVAAGGAAGLSSTGRLFVDDAVIAGGPDSELRIGAQAFGAIGLGVFSNSALGEFERISIGVNSRAPGTSSSSPPAGPAIISSDAPDGTTGELLVAGGSHLNVGGGLGALQVGSRGYLHIDDGATIESGLVVLGAVAGASSPATAGNGAFARITGSGSRIDTELLRVGSTDPVIPRTVLDPGNQLYIEDRAVVAATNVEFSGRATIGIESEAVLIASENIVIGGRQTAPEFAPEQNPVGSADEYTEVSVGTGSFITAGGEIVIGDNTRSGLFEPLYTFASLRLDAGAQLTAGSLIIANGGRLSGGSRTGPAANVTAATTEIFDGGIVSPGFSPGSLSFSGDLIVHSGASLILEIGGRDPGISYDQIIVAGTLSGKANLELHFIDGFLPEVSEEFTLFSAGTGLNLQLNTIAFSGLAPDAILDFTPGAAGMTGFSVVSLGTAPVPLPGSFGLFLTALGAGLSRRAIGARRVRQDHAIWPGRHGAEAVETPLYQRETYRYTPT